MAPTTKAVARAKKAPGKAVAQKRTAKVPARNNGSIAKLPAKKNAVLAKAPAKKTKAIVAKVPAKKTKAIVAKVPAKKKAIVAKVPAKKKAIVAKVPARKKAIVAKARAPKPGAAATRSRVIPALAKRMPFDSTKKAPPKRTGPLDKFLLGQLETLTEARITYTRQAVSLKAEADLLVAEREPGDVQFDEESGEGDTLAVERERDLALSAQAAAAADEIDLAVAKLHDGTYGVCEQCYSNIPRERLRALPYAALCVQCKTAGFSRR